MSENDGLGGTIGTHPWSRGREVGRDVLRSSSKLSKVRLRVNGEESRFFVVCFLPHQLLNEFLVDVWVTHVTYHRPKCESPVTLGWVGDLNQLIEFKFHDGIVGLVDRCLPRTLIKVGVCQWE